MTSYFASASLLQTPTKRAAYSDRTAYMMAEMSRLAYFRFEGGTKLEEIIKSIKHLTTDKEKIAELESIIKSSLIPGDPKNAEAALDDILREQEFELVKTFNNTQTDAQAFICRNTKTKMAVLAFRGTEKKFKDIKADVQANLVETSLGSRNFFMHSGYLNQFSSIKDDLASVLKGPDLAAYQVFITGHSLGGALAITATRFLANDHTAACYTYGSPPVGTSDFDSDITTPIYRIINHVDIVPRLPNPTMVFVIRYLAVGIGFLLDMLGGLSNTIKKSTWYKKASQFLSDAQKYRQSGYGSYLVGDGVNTRLRYSVSSFDRFWWWIKQFKNVFKKDFEIFTDHSIETYSNKLAAWANYRQQQKQHSTDH